MSKPDLKMKTRLAMGELLDRVLGSVAPRHPATPSRALDLSELEERILLSASPVMVVAEMVDAAPADSMTVESATVGTATVGTATDSSSSADASTSTEQSSSSLTTDPSQTATRELVFLDTSVEDYQTLLNDLWANDDPSREIEVVLLSSSRDGVEQISEALADRSDLDAIHFVTHGTDRAVKLGATWLSLDNLGGYSGEVAGWGKSLTGEADLLFYGCDLAASDSGIELLESIQTLTGADLAASTDDTGAAILGADWDLEFEIGEVESRIVFSQTVQAEWQGLLNTFTVTNTNDSGAGSLRQAIIDANALAGTDSITLGAGVYNFDLAGVSGENSAATGDLDITDDLIIIGADAATTIIDAQDVDRVFDVIGANVTISGLTITGGSEVDGAGIFVDGASTLTLSEVIVTGNSAAGSGADGGGVQNLGTVNLMDVVLSTNSAERGGGLSNEGVATLTRVTVSGNSANFGGGLRNANGSTLNLTNVTVSGNNAFSDGGGLFNAGTTTLMNVTISENTASGDGGGIAQANGPTTTNVTNSIIAGNTATNGNDVRNSVASGGFNIVGNSLSSGGWVDSDQLDVDPLLNAMADNGGFTQTYSLQGGSTAIDQGTNTGAPITDQRGRARNDGSTDIGAFEVIPASATILDQFNAVSYTGNDGTQDWDGDWVETDSGGIGSGNGKVQVLSGELRLQGAPVSGTDPSLAREANLSGATAATLTFDYRTGSGVESADPDSLVLEISGNGGTSWVTLEDFNSFDGVNSGNRSYDISAYISPDTQIRFRINNGYGGPDEYFYVDNVQIEYSTSASNVAPTIGLPGGPLSYTEGDGVVVIDSTATASDSDSSNFDTGTLTVDFTAGATSNDRLAINNEGTGSGQIGVSGAFVEYEGTRFGAFTGGTDGSTPLVITFDSNATPAAAQALMRNITFENVSENPSESARTVRFVLTDGDGGTSNTATQTVNVAGDNDLPVITSNGGLATAAVNTDENSTAVTTVTSSDVDGGTPMYSISGGADSAKFAIGSSSGVLTFVAAPDFEAPTDAGSNNVYDVTVTVSDGHGGTDSQDISVTVTDVAISSVSATGSATASAGGSYTLNLSADEDATAWTINWGDGSIDNVAGNPSSVMHTYATGTAGLTFNILVSATDAAGNYFMNDLVTPTAFQTGDGLYRFDGPTGAFAQTFTDGSLSNPYAAIIGPDGLLYVAGHTSDNVVRFNASTGAFVDEFVAGGIGGLNAAAGLAFGPDGNLYVSNQIGDSILKFNGTTGALLGTFVTSGSGGLNAPVDLAFRSDGYLYVGSYNTSSVLRYDATTGVFADTFVTTGAGGLSGPGAFEWGANGNLFIASNNSTVKEFNGVTGAYVGDFVTTGLGGLGEATGLAFGPDGDLYVGSYTTDEIIRYDGSTGALIGDYATSGGNGLDGPTTFTFLPDHQVEVLSNTAPSISLPGGTLNYTEGDGAFVIDATATASDVDSADLDTGRLTVDFTANSTANDRLSVRNEGTSSGQIGVSGSNVLYEGTTIGTFAGGTDGSTPLVITFDGNATPAAAQALMRNITFENVSENPSQLTRTARFMLTDGDGGTSNTATQTVHVAAVNDDPVTANLDGDTLNYTEGGGAVLLEQGGDAVVSDVDSSDFSGGELIVEIDAGLVAAEDVLAIRNEGTASGEIGVSGTDVTYGGTVIGTFTGGTGIAPLTVTFNSNATPAAVTALVRNVTYENTGGDIPTPGARSVAIDITDGDGGASPTQNLTINVAAVNDAPVADLNGADDGGIDYSTTFDEGDPPVSIADTDATITDPDHTTYQGVGINIGGFVDGTSELIRVNGEQFQASVSRVATTTVGGTLFDLDFDGTGFTITDNGGGTIPEADLQALLRTITYENTSQNPTAGNRTFNVIPQDASTLNATPAAVSTVTVSAVNDDPTNEGSLPTDVSVTEDVSSFVDFPDIDFADVDHNNQLVTLTFRTSTGGNLIASSDLDVIVAGSGSSVLQLTGGVADINTFMNSPTRVSYLHGTPHTNGDNADTIQVEANDLGNTGTGGGGTVVFGTVNVDITAVNDAPTITGIADQTPLEDTATGAIAFTVGDVETAAGSLIVTATSDDQTLVPDANITLGGSGASRTINVLPGLNQTGGPATITVTVDDGTTTTQTTFDVTVTPDNDAPTITGIADQTPLEDTATGAIAFTVGDVETAAGSLIVTATSDDQTLVPDANITLGGSGASRTINVLPASNEHGGPATITVTVDDGTTTTQTTFDVTVTSVNDDPVITSTATPSVNENQSSVVTITATDVDQPAQTITYAITGGADELEFALNPTSGILVFLGNRDFEFPTDADTDNVYEVQITATDGNGGSDVQSMFVTVNDLNDNAPVITASQAFNVSEDAVDTTSLGSVAATDADTVGSLQSWTITGGNTGSIFGIDPATGELTVADNTNLNFEGTSSYTLSLTVSDGTNSSAVETVSIIIDDANDDPTITSASSASAPENQTAVMTVTASDEDLPAQTLTYSLTGGADLGAFAIGSSSGVLTFVSSPDFETPTDAGMNNVYDVEVTVSDGVGGSSVQLVAVTVTDVNDAPTITGLAGDSTSFNENDPPKKLDTSSDAVVSDVDSANFDGGNLTVSIVAGGVGSEDVLSIIDDGNGAGAIGFDGSNVTYGGTLIGTATGGTSGADLVITLNANADATSLSELIHNVTYENIVSNPTELTRSIRFNLSDGDGATSPNYDTSVAVAGSNNVPTVSLPGGPLAYTENDGAVLIDGAATADDVDSSNFDTGTLTIDFTANGTANDRLAINNQGTGSGQIGVSGSNVTYEGTTIGTFAGGTDGSTPLVITLNASSTPTAAQSLLRNVTFENVSEEPSVLARTTRFVLTDGDGGTSAPATQTINVAAANDDPSGSGSLTTTSLNDNAGATNLFGGLSVTDVDTGEADLSLTITLTTPSAGTISGGGFTETGVGTGIYTATGLTTATADTALDNVQFTPTNNTGFSGTFNTAMSVTVDDQGGGGEQTVLAATTVTITRINDNPSGSGSLTTTSLNDNAGATNLFGGLSVTDVDMGEADLSLTITLTTPSAGTISGGGFTETGVGTGIYTVTGLTTATADTTLDNVQFTPTNNSGSSGTFNTDMSVTVNDQGGGGEQIVLSPTTVTITHINDAPVVDLNGADGAGVDYSTTFQEGDSPVSVADTDATISDVDDSTYQNLGVNLSGFVDGSSEEIRINGEVFTYAVGKVTTTTVGATLFSLDFDGTGFTITEDGGGTIPVADIQALLRTVSYENTSLNPTAENRTFNIIPQDAGSLNGTAAVSTVSVTGVNNRPTLTAFGDSVDTTLEDTEVEISFAEIAAQGNESDADGTVTAFVVKSVSSGTLKIGLTADTATAYSAGVNNVIDSTLNAYWAPSLNSNGTKNAFTVVARDNLGLESIGNIAVPVDVTEVNDAPTATIVPTGIGFTEDDPSRTIGGASVSDIDAGLNDISATLSVSNGDLNLTTTTGLNFTAGANGTSTLTFEGTVSEINNALATLAYQPDPDFNGSDTLTLFVDDLGNSGGGSKTAMDTAMITVAAVNDASTLDLDGNNDSGATVNDFAQSFLEGGGPVSLVDDDVTLSDIDSANLSSILVVLTNRLDPASKEGLSADASGTLLAASWDSGTDTLTIDGSGSVADYLKVLSTVKYDNTSNNPDPTTRTITFVANDGVDDSLPATTTLSFSAVNDAPTITSDGGAATAALSVVENVAEVTTVTSTDVDGGTPAYSITGGLDLAKFSIASGSGVLKFVTAPDFETPTDSDFDNEYEVTVTVSDGNGGVDSQDITVTVTADNDNDPVITSDGGGTTFGVEIAENSTAVTTVTATDADLPTQTLSYSISGGADLAKFNLDSGSGVLTFVSGPDFDIPADSNGDNDFEVTVQVSDGAGRTDSQDITVSVTDLNDTTPVVDNGQSFFVIESAGNGTSLGTVAATDPDTLGSLQNWAIVGGNTGTAFSIDDSTGELTVNNAAVLDFETTPTFTLSVRVSDGANTSVDQTVTINVTNVNDAPTISAPASDTVTSGVTLTFSAGNGNSISVADVEETELRIQLSADDGVLTLSQKLGLTFSLGTGTADSSMTFEGSIASINAALDGLEFVHGDNHSGVRTITVEATDFSATGPGGPLTTSQPISVTVVTPVGPPVAGDAFLQGNFLEVGLGGDGVVGSQGNAPVGFNSAGAILGVEVDHDRDGFGVGQVDGDFILPGTPEEAFGVSVGGTTTFNSNSSSQAIAGSLSNFQDNGVTQTLDFNGAASGLEIDATHSVGVNDQFMDVTVTLTNSTGAAMSDVYYFRNVDADNNFDTSGTFATTNAIISQGNDGSAQAYVTATQADGSLLGLLGFGENARVTRGGFTNRDPIAIWNGTDGLSQTGAATLDEAVSLAFKYDTIGAGESVTLRYRYVFGETQSPVLDLDPDGSTGAAATNINVSYTENDGAISLVEADATIFDGDSKTLTSLTVQITNDLDGAVEFLSADTTGTSITAAAYNSATGVLTLSGSDTVANYRQVLRTLSYTNTSETPDTTTREIQFVATDGTYTSNTARAFVSVSATNDVPVITSNGGAATASISIAENETEVTTVTSSDLDSDTPKYSITGGADSARFNIDSGSGTLTFATAPDFEDPTDSNTNNQYEVTVTVSDGQGGTDSQDISVTVSAVNDNQPVITSNGSGATASIDVAENSTVVTTVIATDGDLPAQDLDYTISGGADAASFSIDGVSGELTFSAAPNFEAATDIGADNDYEVIVRVSDGISFFDKQTITVSVTDIDEFDVSAISDADNGTDSVNENSDVEDSVGIRASATDDDGSNNVVTYSLDDNSNGEFFIEPSAGDIKVASPLDREAGATRTVTVRATSADGSFSTKDFTININDLNDNAPIISVGQTFGVSEFASNGDGVGTATATDADTVGVIQNWTISGGNDDRVFKIDTASGELRVANNSWLNFETTATYVLSLRVEDGANTSSTQTVTVNVVDENDVPVLTVNAGIPVVEGGDVMISSAELEVSDEDGLPGDIRYSIVDSPSTGRLELTSDPGVSISSFTQADIDNNLLRLVHDGSEADDSFTFSISDGSGGTIGTTLFSISNLRVNDAPVNSVPVSQTTSEDTPLVFSSAGSNAVFVSDVDLNGGLIGVRLVATNGTLTLGATSGLVFAAGNGSNAVSVRDVDLNGGLIGVRLVATNGTLTLGATSGLVFAAGNGSNDSDLIFAGLIDDVNDALEGLTFTPGADYNGPTTVRIVTRDMGSSGSGGEQIDDDTINILVTSVNDNPIAADDEYSTSEDNALTVTAASGLLSNDSDIDGDALTVVAVSVTTNGALSVNGDGSFVYTPNANFNGVDSFTYQATDGSLQSETRTVTLNVAAVNDASVSVDDEFTIDQLTVLELSAANGVLVNDRDVEVDALQAVLVDGPQNGRLVLNADGSLTYTPNATFFGEDTFTYRSVDGSDDGSIATVRIVVRQTVTSGGDGDVVIVEESEPMDVDKTNESGEGDAGTGAVGDDAVDGSVDSDPGETSTTPTIVSPTDPSGETTDTTQNVNNSDDDDGRSTNGGSTNGSEKIQPTFVAAFRVDERGELRDRVTGRVVEDAGVVVFTSTDVGSMVYVLEQTGFWTELDTFEQDVQASILEEGEWEELVVETTTVAGTTLTVGYIVWLLRSGSVVFGLISSLPAWTMMDPLPVLQSGLEGLGDTDNSDDDSLQGILQAHHDGTESPAESFEE